MVTNFYRISGSERGQGRPHSSPIAAFPATRRRPTIGGGYEAARLRAAQSCHR